MIKNPKPTNDNASLQITPFDGVSFQSHSLLYLILSLTHKTHKSHKSSINQSITHKKTPQEIFIMASVTSATVAIPSFTGLKSTISKPSAIVRLPTTTSRNLTVKSSLKDFGVAAVAAAASIALAGNAMAIDVLLGSGDGALAFVPNDFTIAKGEKIVFKNNAGFPHNVVFDEDEIPSGVDASKISMDEQDLLNGPGETYEVALTEPGTYSFYCAPHQGAGMVGKVTVN